MSSGCAAGLCWMPWRQRTGWELLAKEISSPAVFQVAVGSLWSAGLEKSHHLLPLILPAHVTGEFQVVRLPWPKNCFSCCFTLSQCLVCFGCDLLPDLLRVTCELSEVVLLAVNRTLDGAGEKRRAGQLYFPRYIQKGTHAKQPYWEEEGGMFPLSILLVILHLEMITCDHLCADRILIIIEQL